MAFYIGRNKDVHITAGDTAELDIRLFNKDWHMHREPSPFMKREIYPLLPLIELDSEGNPQFVFDSEGYPIYPVDSEGMPIWVKPERLPRDSEGNLIIDIDKIKPYQWPFIKRYPWPRWRQIEELIKKWDLITLKVVDITSRETVLTKINDEFPNTIFLEKADTEELEPKLYLYQLIYEPYHSDLDEEDMEKNTVITGIFEVMDKF